MPFLLCSVFTFITVSIGPYRFLNLEIHTVIHIIIISATYDFLLAIPSNHGPMSYTVYEINGDFGQKNTNFSLPVYVMPRLGSSPWNLVTAITRGKTRVIGSCPYQVAEVVG